MSNPLKNTLLHRAMLRAWPHSTWPELALQVLTKYQEGSLIDADTLEKAERKIFVDLATAGMVESHRYPKFEMGIFGGFKYVYVYRSDLAYANAPNHKKKRDKTEIVLWVAIVTTWIIAAVTIYVSIKY